MKHLHLLLMAALAFAFTACQQNSYKIEGTAEGFAEGDTLFLTQDFNMGIPSDTFIVKKGAFEISGTADSTVLAMIYAQNNPELNATFFMEPGTINIQLAKEPGLSVVGGTTANNAWQELNQTLYEFGQKMQTAAEQMYSEELSEEENQAAIEKMNAMQAEMSAKIFEATKANINNEFGYFLVTNYSDGDSFTPENRRELINMMPSKFRERQAIKDIEEMLKAIEANKEAR